MRQPSFSTWHVPGLTSEVVYSEVLMRRLAEEARAGSRRFPPGGVEVAGVLFGTQEEGEIRITAARRLDDEQQQQADFRASEADAERLRELVERAESDPELQDLAPVGWYRSRTRSAIQLSDGDVKLFNQYFPLAWQVTLVLQPVESGGVRAGFFVRPSRGPMHTDGSYLEFDAFGDGGAEPVRVPEVGTLSRPPAAMMSPVKRRAGRRTLLIAATVVLTALIASGVGGYVFGRSDARTESVPPLALALVQNDDALKANWNGSAPGLARATWATLQVNDGGTVADFPLSPALLRDGFWPIRNLTQDVTVRLKVDLPDFGEVAEVARYVGRVVEKRAPEGESPEAAPLREEVERIQEELARTSQENARVELRFAELQAALKLSQAPPPQQAPPPEPAPRQAAPQNPPVQTATSSPSPPQVSASPGSTTTPPPSPPLFREPTPREPTPREPVREPTAGVKPAPSPAASLPPAPSTPQPPPEPVAPPAYTGPRSGRLIWTGYLAAGGTVNIQGRAASTGNVNGAVPPASIRVTVYPAEFSSSGLSVYSAQQRHSSGSVTEPRSAQNGWMETRYVYNPDRARGVTVTEAPATGNGYRLTLRGGDRPVSVVMIEWQVTQ